MGDCASVRREVLIAVASDPFELLARALEQAGSVIAGIKEEQAELPTPCSSWDVVRWSIM